MPKVEGFLPFRDVHVYAKHPFGFSRLVIQGRRSTEQQTL